MTWLRDKIACDGESCDETFRGPTFPPIVANATASRAHDAGWRDITPGRTLAADPRHLCPTCYARTYPEHAAREAVEHAAREAVEHEALRSVREAMAEEHARRVASVKVVREDGQIRIVFPYAPSAEVTDLLRANRFAYRGAAGWFAGASPVSEQVATTAITWFAQKRRRR